MKYKLTLFLAVVFLVSCNAVSPLKAPCDQAATSCGTKTKINQSF